MRKYDEEYRRNLPHIQPDDGTFAISYRISGTLPKSVIEYYETEYERQKSNTDKLNKEGELFFNIIDDYLDKSKNKNILKNEMLAGIVADSLRFYDEKYFKLIAYCIMPNHVHVILDKESFPQSSLTSLFGSIKGYSAYNINKELGSGGKFWSSEIYDHLIRNDKDLINQIKYLINNPVKANLVEEWEEWKYSFLRDGYLDC